MKQTKNLKLMQFEGTDKFDYKVMNENWQRIDDALQGAEIYNVSSDEELDTILKTVYQNMSNNTIKDIVVIDNGNVYISSGGTHSFITLYKTNNNYGSISAIKSYSSSPNEWKRSIYNGVFGDWCWVNPPMGLGVEYRTTEKYAGLPVYKKVISIGNLPSNTSDTLYCETEIRSLNTNHIISVQLLAGSGDNSGINLTHLPTIKGVWCTHSAIHIVATEDISNLRGIVVLSYTKNVTQTTQGE